MPSHSFIHKLRNAIVLLSFTLPALSSAWITSSCTADPDLPDVLRIELNSNIWASNTSLTPQRGVFLWVGSQYWDPAHNSGPVSYPILTVLSTSFNETYISTSSTGSQDAACPNSYSYNSNYSESDLWNNDYTFDTSFICHEYYDLSTSVPIYLESSTNFTGSPEDASSTTELQSADVRYGVTRLSLVLPRTYLQSSTPPSPITTVAFFGTGSHIFGFVDKHEDQVLGLGLNSTFLNDLYEGGFIASRSIGLYYGIPASAGPSQERNGSLILGGYSSSRLLGNFSSQTYPIGNWKLARHCPWEIDVASISAGSQASTSGFTACVEPSELSLVLPTSLYSQFSGSTSNLTITLTNGLIATIPSSIVSLRPETDEDQSPILGAPFLSQVYLFADYQEKTLSTGLANNTAALTSGPDVLTCIQHGNQTGDVGWAVGSPAELASASNTTPGSGATGTATGKKSGGGRVKVQGELAVLLVLVLSMYVGFMI